MEPFRDRSRNRSLKRYYYYYYYYYYCELYSHMTGNNVSDGNEKSDESSEQG